MLENMITLISGTNFFGQMFEQWETSGIFAYVLPFILMFALIYGILTKVQIFKGHNAVNATIAAAVGLMAIRTNIVNDFFIELFPRMGVGIAVLLALFILVGMFIPKKNWVIYSLFGAGVLIFAIVLISSSTDMGLGAGAWWFNNWESIVGVLLFIVVIVVIVMSGTSGTPTTTSTAGTTQTASTSDLQTPFFNNLFGGSNS